MDDLPKTFRDAVTFARGMGIGYLWIDSLCILQDDRDDWLADGQKMDQIFTNAAFVISADFAADSRENGLFRSRNAKWEFHINFDDMGDERDQVVVREFNDFCGCAS